MGWLVSLFTGGAGGYLISAGVGALLAASAAIYGTHEIDQIALSKAQAQTSQAISSLKGYEAQVAASAAKADADALKQKQAQDAAANALQEKLLQAQKEENAKSDQLKAILNKAAPGEIHPLGEPALAYFAGLRQLQSAATAPNR